MAYITYTELAEEQKKPLTNRAQLRAHWKKKYNKLTWEQFKKIWDEGKNNVKGWCEVRKIKFRGKLISDFDSEKFGVHYSKGDWVYGNLVRSNGEPYIVGNVVNSDYDYVALEYWYRVDPETVGQFTGLKDRSGKEIYEGDIVLCENKTLGVVRYDEFEALYHVGVNPIQYYVCNTQNPEFMEVFIEIVGNIYDSPEIFESEEK